MKKGLIIAIAIVFLATDLKAQSQVLTLDSCFALAKANNVQLKTNQLEIEKAQEVKAQVFTKYFPQVSLSYMAYYAARPLVEFGVNDIHDSELGNFLAELISTLNDPEGLNLGLPTKINLFTKGHAANATALVPVYAGGRIANGNRLATLGIEAAQLKGEVNERDLMENIESSYFLVLGLQNKVNTLESALSLIDSLGHTVDVAIKAGIITKSDKLRVEMKRNEMKAKQLQLSNGIFLASQLLCHQIGIECPESGLVLDTASLNQDNYPNFSAKGDFVRPETRLLQLQVDANKLYKKLTLGETLPQVALGGLVSFGNVLNSYRLNGIALARVSIPITDWFETSHKLKEHDLKIKEAELMQKDLGEMMKLQEKQAYYQMTEARALLQSEKTALEMAKENQRLADLNYRAGMNTITDVLEANTLLLQAQNAIIDQQITYLTARRRYFDLNGQPTTP